VVPTGMFKFCRRHPSLFELGHKGGVILLSHLLSVQRAMLVLQHKFYAVHPKVR
jgi:hypothetical protein